MFTSTVLIERPGAEGAFDPNTGQVAAAERTEIYQGPALVRSLEQGTDVIAGEREIRLRGARLKVPHDTPIQKDDVVTVTASRHDSGLVGRVYRIVDVPHDEWQVVRNAALEEVT